MPHDRDQLSDKHQTQPFGGSRHRRPLDSTNSAPHPSAFHSGSAILQKEPSPSPTHSQSLPSGGGARRSNNNSGSRRGGLLALACVLLAVVAILLLVVVLVGTTYRARMAEEERLLLRLPPPLHKRSQPMRPSSGSSSRNDNSRSALDDSSTRPPRVGAHLPAPQQSRSANASTAVGVDDGSRSPARSPHTAVGASPPIAGKSSHHRGGDEAPAIATPNAHPLQGSSSSGGGGSGGGGGVAAAIAARHARLAAEAAEDAAQLVALSRTEAALLASLAQDHLQSDEGFVAGTERQTLWSAATILRDDRRGGNHSGRPAVEEEDDVNQEEETENHSADHHDFTPMATSSRAGASPHETPLSKEAVSAMGSPRWPDDGDVSPAAAMLTALWRGNARRCTASHGDGFADDDGDVVEDPLFAHVDPALRHHLRCPLSHPHSNSTGSGNGGGNSGMRSVLQVLVPVRGALLPLHHVRAWQADSVPAGDSDAQATRKKTDQWSQGSGDGDANTSPLPPSVHMGLVASAGTLQDGPQQWALLEAMLQETAAEGAGGLTTGECTAAYAARLGASGNDDGSAQSAMMAGVRVWCAASPRRTHTLTVLLLPAAPNPLAEPMEAELLHMALEITHLMGTWDVAADTVGTSPRKTRSIHQHAYPPRPPLLMVLDEGHVLAAQVAAAAGVNRDPTRRHSGGHFASLIEEFEALRRPFEDRCSREGSSVAATAPDLLAWAEGRPVALHVPTVALKDPTIAPQQSAAQPTDADVPSILPHLPILATLPPATVSDNALSAQRQQRRFRAMVLEAGALVGQFHAQSLRRALPAFVHDRFEEPMIVSDEGYAVHSLASTSAGRRHPDVNQPTNSSAARAERTIPPVAPALVPHTNTVFDLAVFLAAGALLPEMALLRTAVLHRVDEKQPRGRFGTGRRVDAPSHRMRPLAVFGTGDGALLLRPTAAHHAQHVLLSLHTWRRRRDEALLRLLSPGRGLAASDAITPFLHRLRAVAAAVQAISDGHNKSHTPPNDPARLWARYEAALRRAGLGRQVDDFRRQGAGLLRGEGVVGAGIGVSGGGPAPAPNERAASPLEQQYLMRLRFWITVAQQVLRSRTQHMAELAELRRGRVGGEGADGPQRWEQPDPGDPAFGLQNGDLKVVDPIALKAAARNRQQPTHEEEQRRQPSHKRKGSRRREAMSGDDIVGIRNTLLLATAANDELSELIGDAHVFGAEDLRDLFRIRDAWDPVAAALGSAHNSADRRRGHDQGVLQHDIRDDESVRQRLVDQFRRVQEKGAQDRRIEAVRGRQAAEVKARAREALPPPKESQEAPLRRLLSLREEGDEAKSEDDGRSDEGEGAGASIPAALHVLVRQRVALRERAERRERVLRDDERRSALMRRAKMNVASEAALQSLDLLTFASDVFEAEVQHLLPVLQGTSGGAGGGGDKPGDRPADGEAAWRHPQDAGSGEEPPHARLRRYERLLSVVERRLEGSATDALSYFRRMLPPSAAAALSAGRERPKGADNGHENRRDGPAGRGYWQDAHAQASGNTAFSAVIVAPNTDFLWRVRDQLLAAARVVMQAAAVHWTADRPLAVLHVEEEEGTAAAHDQHHQPFQQQQAGGDGGMVLRFRQGPSGNTQQDDDTERFVDADVSEADPAIPFPALVYRSRRAHRRAAGHLLEDALGMDRLEEVVASTAATATLDANLWRSLHDTLRHTAQKPHSGTNASNLSAANLSAALLLQSIPSWAEGVEEAHPLVVAALTQALLLREGIAMKGSANTNTVTTTTTPSAADTIAGSQPVALQNMVLRWLLGGDVLATTVSKRFAPARADASRWLTALLSDIGGPADRFVESALGPRPVALHLRTEEVGYRLLLRAFRLQEVLAAAVHRRRNTTRDANGAPSNYMYSHHDQCCQHSWRVHVAASVAAVMDPAAMPEALRGYHTRSHRVWTSAGAATTPRAAAVMKPCHALHHLPQNTSASKRLLARYAPWAVTCTGRTDRSDAQSEENGTSSTHGSSGVPRPAVFYTLRHPLSVASHQCALLACGAAYMPPTSPADLPLPPLTTPTETDTRQAESLAGKSTQRARHNATQDTLPGLPTSTTPRVRFPAQQVALRPACLAWGPPACPTVPVVLSGRSNNGAASVGCLIDPLHPQVGSVLPVPCTDALVASLLQEPPSTGDTTTAKAQPLPLAEVLWRCRAQQTSARLVASLRLYATAHVGPLLSAFPPPTHTTDNTTPNDVIAALLEALEDRGSSARAAHVLLGAAAIALPAARGGTTNSPTSLAEEPLSSRSSSAATVASAVVDALRKALAVRDRAVLAGVDEYFLNEPAESAAVRRSGRRPCSSRNDREEEAPDSAGEQCPLREVPSVVAGRAPLPPSTSAGANVPAQKKGPTDSTFDPSGGLLTLFANTSAGRRHAVHVRRMHDLLALDPLRIVQDVVVGTLRRPLPQSVVDAALDLMEPTPVDDLSLRAALRLVERVGRLAEAALFLPTEAPMHLSDGGTGAQTSASQDTSPTRRDAQSLVLAPPADGASVFWNAYCCGCCGFSAEMLHFLQPMAKATDIHFLIGQQCFCTGARAEVEATLARSYMDIRTFGTRQSLRSATTSTNAAARSEHVFLSSSSTVSISGASPRASRLAKAATRLWQHEGGGGACAWQQSAVPSGTRLMTAIEPSLFFTAQSGRPSSSHRGDADVSANMLSDPGDVFIVHTDPMSYAGYVKRYAMARRPATVVGRTMYEMSVVPEGWMERLNTPRRLFFPVTGSQEPFPEHSARQNEREERDGEGHHGHQKKGRNAHPSIPLDEAAFRQSSDAPHATVDELWVPSRFVHMVLLNSGLRDPSRMVLIHEGIDTESYDPARLDPIPHLLMPPQQQLQQQKGAPQFVFPPVGRARVMGNMGADGKPLSSSTNSDSSAAPAEVDSFRWRHWCNRPPGPGWLDPLDPSFAPVSSAKGGTRRPPFRLLSAFKWEPRKGWDVLLEAYYRAFSRTFDRADPAAVDRLFAQHRRRQKVRRWPPSTEGGAEEEGEGMYPHVANQTAGGSSAYDGGGGVATIEQCPWFFHDPPAASNATATATATSAPHTLQSYDDVLLVIHTQMFYNGISQKSKDMHDPDGVRRRAERWASHRRQLPCHTDFDDEEAERLWGKVVGRSAQRRGPNVTAALPSSPYLPDRLSLEELLRRPAPGSTFPTVCVITEHLDEAVKRRLYRSADAFVLPTRGEGWGLPLMEAMAAGLPTIATDWGGNVDFTSARGPFSPPPSPHAAARASSKNNSTTKGALPWSQTVRLEGLEEVRRDSLYGYAPGKRMAAPSAKHLAERMRDAFLSFHRHHDNRRKGTKSTTTGGGISSGGGDGFTGDSGDPFSPLAAMGLRGRAVVDTAFSEDVISASTELRLAMIANRNQG